MSERSVGRGQWAWPLRMSPHPLAAMRCSRGLRPQVKIMLAHDPEGRMGPKARWQAGGRACRAVNGVQREPGEEQEDKEEEEER